MATINKKLIHFLKLSDFETRLANKEILDSSIVFIKDANKIWTHDTYYDCNTVDLSNIEEIVSKIKTGGDGTKFLSNNGEYKEISIPTKTSQLENDKNFIDSNYVDTAITNKVDKISGKGLSTNDYTTTEKNKLAGIAAGAQVNTITGVKGNSETTYRTGNVNITAANIGLGNVNNTSDANKPVSTATQTALNKKQDTISDLANIRNGAVLGSTAVQPSDLANVAVSGSYNDLIEVPTVLTGGSQTNTSTTDGGTNVYTFTKSDGTTSTLSIKNGTKGSKGDTGTAGKSVGSVVCVTANNGTTTGNASTADSGITYYRVKDTSGNWLSGTIAVQNGSKGSTGSLGSAGTSVTISNISQSTAAGGTSTITFSDGNALSIKNGSNGTNATTTSVVSSSANGLAPKFATGGGTIDSTSNDYVLTSDNGTIGWRLLPANAFKNDNTTYNAGTGLALSSNTFKCNLKSETKATYDSATVTNTTNRQYAVVVDKSGYLSVNVPWVDNNTHWTTRIHAGASSTAANSAATDPYIKVSDDNTYRSQIQIKGSGATTVSSDANGIITISSTDTNTDTNTWRSILVNGTLILASTTNTKALNLKAGTNITLANSDGTVTINGPSLTDYATKSYVDSAVTGLFEYKGTIGTGGTVTALPASHNVGDVYYVKTAGTYAGVACEVGDMIICNTVGTTSNNAHWNVVQGNWTATDGSATLSWGKTVTLATIGGVNIDATLPANPNSDSKVAYTAASADVNHPILFANNSSSTASPATGGVYYESNSTDGSGLTYNPSTNILSIPSAGTVKIGGKTLSELYAGAEDTSTAITTINTSIDNINTSIGTINTNLGKKAPTSHASSATTYGVGTTSNYGHVKISNGDCNTVSSADGLAAGMNHTHGNYITIGTSIDDILAEQVTLNSNQYALICTAQPWENGNTDGHLGYADGYYLSSTGLNAATLRATTIYENGTALSSKYQAKGTYLTAQDHYKTSITAGSFGPSANATLSHSGTFTVPYVTVNANGHISAIKNITYTLPSSGNTDTKVNVTLGTTTKAYLLGTSTTPASTAAATSTIADTGVYLGTTAGSLYATTLYENGTSLANKYQAKGNYLTTTTKYAGSSSVGGAANSVANSIIVKLNGGTTEGTNLFTFNGSTAKTINITPSSIGAATTSQVETAATTVSYDRGGSGTYYLLSSENNDENTSTIKVESAVYCMHTGHNSGLDTVLVTSNMALEGYFASNLIPYTNGTYSLGNPDHRWNAYIKDLTFTGKVNGNFSPSSAEQYSLGDSTYKWYELYTDYINTKEIWFSDSEETGIISYDNDLARFNFSGELYSEYICYLDELDTVGGIIGYDSFTDQNIIWNIDTNGDAKFTSLKTNKLYAPTTSGGSTYNLGSDGQVLKSNGSSVYWDKLDFIKSYERGAIIIDEFITPGLLMVAYGDLSDYELGFADNDAAVISIPGYSGGLYGAQIAIEDNGTGNNLMCFRSRDFIGESWNEWDTVITSSNLNTFTEKGITIGNTMSVGKTTAYDGNPGVYLSTGGNIALTGNAPIISFAYNNATTVTSAIRSNSTSGIEINYNLDVKTSTSAKSNYILLNFNNTRIFRLNNSTTGMLYQYGTSTSNITTKGTFSTSGAYSSSSDITKKNILSYDLKFTVNDIANAPIAYFTWKDMDDDRLNLGSIALYWNNYAPECVYGTEGIDLTMDYSTLGLISSIINARKIVNHEDRIKILEKENQDLKDELNSLKNIININ